MIHIVFLAVLLFTDSPVLIAQYPTAAPTVLAADEAKDALPPSTPTAMRPNHSLSRIAIGGAVSPLGIGLDLTTDLSSHLNLRTSGGLFNHSIPFNTNGFNAEAKLRLASLRESLDIYPFHSGFRISPGVMFYNQNRVTATDTIAAGSSFTLNGDTFYSAKANAASGAIPVNGTALLNLHTRRPAFTLTAGWGNTLARNRHWSFPVEVGVAFAGAPTLQVNLKGWACHDQAETQCTDISNPNDSIAVQVQNDLHTEVDKWTRDLDPLKTYPIVSAGVAYSFHVRNR
jgi:hypothetical protein